MFEVPREVSKRRATKRLVAKSGPDTRKTSGKERTKRRRVGKKKKELPAASVLQLCELQELQEAMDGPRRWTRRGNERTRGDGGRKEEEEEGKVLRVGRRTKLAFCKEYLCAMGVTPGDGDMAEVLD